MSTRFRLYSTEQGPSTTPDVLDPAPGILIKFDHDPVHSEGLRLTPPERRGRATKTLSGVHHQDFGVIEGDGTLSINGNAEEGEWLTQETVDALKTANVAPPDTLYFFTDGYEVWLVRFQSANFWKNQLWATHGLAHYSYELLFYVIKEFSEGFISLEWNPYLTSDVVLWLDAANPQDIWFHDEPENAIQTWATLAQYSEGLAPVLEDGAVVFSGGQYLVEPEWMSPFQERPLRDCVIALVCQAGIFATEDPEDPGEFEDPPEPEPEPPFVDEAGFMSILAPDAGTDEKRNDYSSLDTSFFMSAGSASNGHEFKVKAVGYRSYGLNMQHNSASPTVTPKAIRLWKGDSEGPWDKKQELRVNGSDVDTDSNASRIANTTGPMALGCRQGVWDGLNWHDYEKFLTGKIWEVIWMYDPKYTDTVEGYLAHKHDLTDALPEDHKYKTRQPMAWEFAL
ncbi:MAG: hypothetical protein RBR42_05090 [Desulfomicrobium sp.]|nr:hypothetical protein [Desulfomicrobium sp.]